MASIEDSASQATNKGADSRSRRSQLSFVTITSSPSFTIVVGPEKHEHLIHAALLADQSPVLDALVHGGMQESQERRVNWEHVEQHTFEYFCQFAYTGDFEIKKPALSNAANNESSSQWLLQHAEVLGFAECYAIDQLLALAASKLEASLSKLPCSSATDIQAIAELSKFVFTTSGPDITRELTTAYLAQHGAALWLDAFFQSIVKEVQGLANAFIGCVIAPAKPKNLRVKFVCDEPYSHEHCQTGHAMRGNCQNCGYDGDLEFPDYGNEVTWT